jgi:hypothetical protein
MMIYSLKEKHRVIAGSAVLRLLLPSQTVAVPLIRDLLATK